GRKRNRENDRRHIAGETERLGEGDDGSATNERYGRIRTLSQRPIALGKADWRQHSESSGVLREGNRARSKLRAGLRRACQRLHSIPVLHWRRPARGGFESE